MVCAALLLGKGVRLNFSSLDGDLERWCVVSAISIGERRKAPLLGRVEAIGLNKHYIRTEVNY